MNTHCKTRYHIISIAYISLMIILIALGVVVYLQQYASADYLQNSTSDTTSKSVESFASDTPYSKDWRFTSVNREFAHYVDKARMNGK